MFQPWTWQQHTSTMVRTPNVCIIERFLTPIKTEIKLWIAPRFTSLMSVNQGCIQLASGWAAGEHWQTMNIHRLDSMLHWLHIASSSLNRTHSIMLMRSVRVAQVMHGRISGKFSGRCNMLLTLVTCWLDRTTACSPLIWDICMRPQWHSLLPSVAVFVFVPKRNLKPLSANFSSYVW